MRNDKEMLGLTEEQKENILKSMVDLKVEVLSDCKDISEKNKENMCRKVAVSK